MAQTRGVLVSDHLELPGTVTIYSDILDMGENPQDFWANAGEWFIKVDEAFSSVEGTSRVYIMVYTDDNPDMSTKTLCFRYNNVLEEDLVVNFNFPIREGYEIPEGGPTQRYLQIRYNITTVPFTTGKLSAGFLLGYKDMKSKLTFDVNGPEDEGKLEYLLDTDAFDTWVYNQGRVVSAERTSDISIYFPQAIIGYGDKDKWMEFIRIHYAPVVWPRSCYDVEFEKNENSVVLTIKIDGVAIETDVWDAETNYITYSAHPAIDWSWADFFMYSKYLKDFMNAIETFDKQS